MINQPLFTIADIIEVAIQLDPHGVIFAPFPRLVKRFHLHAVVGGFGDRQMKLYASVFSTIWCT